MAKCRKVRQGVELLKPCSLAVLKTAMFVLLILTISQVIPSIFWKNSLNTEDIWRLHGHCDHAGL